MTDVLRLTLRGPLASWGEIAVGRVRPSTDRPTRSALLGLLSAILGIRREESASLAELSAGYTFAVACIDRGTEIADFHTVESISKGAIRDHKPRSRADEVRIVSQLISSGQPYRSMIPTKRMYRQDVDYRVFIHGSTPYTLDELVERMATPVFVPYLGRKSCPLSAPMAPMTGDLDTFLEDLGGVDFYWDEEFPATIPIMMTFTRNDQPTSRELWEFGLRNEHYAVVEDRKCT